MAYSANDLMALPLLYAPVACSTSGNNNIVAAVTGRSIVVMQYCLKSSGTVNPKWQTDGAVTGTDLTGLLYDVASSGEATPFSPGGLFAGTKGKTLDLNLSGSIAVGGWVVYVLA